MRKKILAWYMTGYLVPPLFWNIFVKFSGIFSGEEFVSVATNPLQGVYALTFMAILFFMLKSRLKNKNKIYKMPNFYIVSMFLFCFIGPNSGIIGVAGLSLKQIVLANLLSIPLIFLFTVPHIIITTKLLEKHLLSENLVTNKVVVSIKWKLGVSTIYTFCGAMFLLFVFNISLVNSFQGGVNIPALIQKNIIVLLLSLSIAGFNVILMIRNIIHPINDSVEILKNISQGEGDLTKQIEIGTTDEIGLMGKYFNLTVEKIRTLIQTIKYQSESLGDISLDLSSNMEETSSSTNEISSNIQSVKKQSDNLSITVKDSKSALDQIIHSIENLNDLIETQSENVNESSSSIEQMLASVKSVNQTLLINSNNISLLSEESDNGRAELDTMVKDIMNVSKESEGLLGVSKVIEKIASQTNLLAMNAAIEAAHAGASGQGFAVVADEVRNLAESSGEQAKTVSTVLNSIKDSVDRITKSTDQLLSRFNSIGSKVSTVSTQETSIRNAMEEQGAGSQQVLQTILRLNEITQDVKNRYLEILKNSSHVQKGTADLDRISEEVSNSMNEMASGAEQIHAAVNKVNNLSGSNKESLCILQSEVGKFRII